MGTIERIKGSNGWGEAIRAVVQTLRLSGSADIQDAGSRAIEGATDTRSAGSGGTHNNLQPYQVEYIWLRTA